MRVDDDDVALLCFGKTWCNSGDFHMLGIDMSLWTTADVKQVEDSLSYNNLYVYTGEVPGVGTG